MSTAAICNSFKKEILDGVHDLGVADAYKIAVYTTTATNSATTTVFSVTNEVGNSGDYVSGGKTCNPTAGLKSPTLTTGTGHWTPQETSWTGVSFTTDNVLLHKATGGNAVAVFTFASQTVTNGTFTLQMPVDNGTTGLIRIA